MKICFLIPDGVGIRNYLYSDVLKLLKTAGHEIIVWHSLEEEIIRNAASLNDVDLESHLFDHHPDGVLVQLIREASTFARLSLNAKLKSNKTILENWKPNKKSIKSKFLFASAGFLGGFISNQQLLTNASQIGHKFIRSQENYNVAKNFLMKVKPDLLFCTHQRVPSVTAAMVAGRDLGIKTSTAIFSWDNLPKARLPFEVDHYLVWSDYMKNELEEYYPEIPQKSIIVTGTPQFDFYRNKDLILTREDFATKYGLDFEKKWVCFSGCDSLTSPFDPLYLGQVAKAIQKESDIQLIFRQVPVETLDRFEVVLKDNPEIKKIDPEWVHGSHWGNFFPLYSDIQLLANLVCHCQVVINVGSTMALDFATFGNSGIYLNYDQQNNGNWSVDTIYKFQHFRSLDGFDAVAWINSKDEILEKIRLALDHTEQVAPDKEKWFNRIVQPHPTRTAAERIVSAFQDILKN